jgi:transcriptional regulator with XRE-family HTH domain
VRADRHTGKRIKQLRFERRVSQREIAQGIPRVSYAYLSRIEAGERTPSLSALIEIADKLGVSALYLATDDASAPCPFCNRRGGS